MNTCPSCGAAAERHQEPPPSRRTHYECGSYTYTYNDNPEWNHQSDLCFARQRIRNVRDIVTTDSETKEQLIARVRELLQE
jgi:transposase-like protein